MTRELRSKVVGPMPVDSFLDEFLPAKPGRNPLEYDTTVKLFDGVPTTASSDQTEEWNGARLELCASQNGLEGMPESLRGNFGTCEKSRDMYPSLVDAVNDLLSNFEMRVSSSRTRKGRQYGALYPKKEASRPALLFNIQHADLADNFNDGARDEPFLASTELVEQLTGSLVELFNQSSRNWLFAVVVTDPFARLLRCDPAGLLVSEPIHIRVDPRPLVEFLLRFDTLSSSECGLDETVSVQPILDCCLPSDELDAPSIPPAASSTPEPRLSVESVSSIPTGQPSTPRTVVSIPIGGGHEGTINVVVLEQLLSPKTWVGRCTRAYKVWDLHAKTLRFMKEIWRPVGQDMEPESDILREMNEKQVAHVPTLVAGGDVPGSGTRTQGFANAEWVHRGGKCRLDERVKHRLLEDFILEFLQDQQDAKTIFTAIRDGFVAHQEAYEKCGILHRDISDNNILVTEGRGRLVDWELSIRVDKDGIRVHKGARQNYRTGTWYFMSRNMLCMHPKAHALRDDLESFFWLTVSCSICKLQFATRDLGVGNKDDISDIISAVFEPANWNRRAQTHTGGSGKTEFFAGRGPLAGLTFPGNGALTAWCQKWIRIFKKDAQLEDDEEVPYTVPDTLLSHAAMRKSFDEALESLDWSTNPTPPTQPPTEPKEPKTNRAHPDRGLKRKSSGNNKSGSKKSKHSSQRSGQAATNFEGLSPAHALQFSASSSRRSSGSRQMSASTSTRPTSGFPSHGSRTKVSQEPRFDPPSSSVSSPFLHPDSQ